MNNYKKYPLPPHAAHVWADANTLFLGLPETSEETRGHTVQFSLDITALKGLAADSKRCSLEERKAIAPLIVLVETLQARTREQHHASNKIGERAAPTQEELNALTKGLRVTKIEKKVPLKDLTLDDLNIIANFS